MFWEKHTFFFLCLVCVSLHIFAEEKDGQSIIRALVKKHKVFDADFKVAVKASPEELNRVKPGPGVSILLCDIVKGLFLEKDTFEKNLNSYVKSTFKERECMARHICLSDDTYCAKQKERLRQAASKITDRKIAAISLANNASYTHRTDPMDYCMNAHCLQGFRTWLKKTYGSLGGLNTQWGTEFGDWQQVFPETTEQVRNRYWKRKERPPVMKWWNTLNLSSWSDWRTFNDIVFSRALCDFRSELRQQNVKVPIGFCGEILPSPWGGYDLYRLSKAVDFIGMKSIGGAYTILQSFNDKRFPVYVVTGNKPDHTRIWQRLLCGSRGVILTEKTAGGFSGKNPYDKGIVKLLSGLQRVRPRIAIHYSQRSIQADWVFEGTITPRRVKENKYRNEFKLRPWQERETDLEIKENRMLQSRLSLMNILQDLGYIYEFVSSEQIEQGELAKRGYRLFWMPRSISVSSKEASAITEFTEQGGTVVSDILPGSMDEHCRLLKKGFCDELFGIRKINFRFPERETELILENTGIPVVLDRTFAVRSGKVHARIEGRPAVIANRTGKGMTYFLAFDYYHYLHRSGKHRNSSGQRSLMRAFVKDIIKKSGVKPVCSIQGIDENITVNHYTNGKIDVKGLTFKPSDGTHKKTTIGLPKQRHVYDIYSGKYYGITDRVEAEAVSSKPLILVQTSHRIDP